MTDVFIVGGGPAGLAAAIAARNVGLSVVVADGRCPPIDKACGEGLMPDSREAAARIGLELPLSLGAEFRGIRFYGDGRSVEAEFPNGRGIGVRRTALHQLMVDAAVRAGVDLRWNTPVADLEKTNSRWVIGADGSTSRVRRWAGLESSIRNSRRFGQRRHFAIAPWTDFMEIYWREDHQIYITPVAEREVCVASISRSPELRLDTALKTFPQLQGAAVTSSERGSVTATMRLKRVTKGTVALIGDASGSVDAITGDGLCLAFRHAYSLAAAMAAGDLSSYEREHPRLSLRARMMGETLLLLDRRPTVRRFSIAALAAQPWIFRRLLSVHVG